jgi:C4-dicarboxylate-specific signal transduction histidine kinase
MSGGRWEIFDVASQSAAFETVTPIRSGALQPLDLQFVRASALAQTRLQLAVLSGNRRKALEQIDRLVAIDTELERAIEQRTGQLAEPPPLTAEASNDLTGDLADQRLAIASEKLALMSEITLPRLEPAFGGGMGAALAPDEDVEIVEHDRLAGGLKRVAWWAAGFLLLCLVVAALAVMRL